MYLAYVFVIVGALLLLYTSVLMLAPDLLSSHICPVGFYDVLLAFGLLNVYSAEELSYVDGF